MLVPCAIYPTTMLTKKKGDMVTLIILSSAEAFVIILVAAVPTLKPLTRWGKLLPSPQETQLHNSRHRKARDTRSWRQWGVLSLMATAKSESQNITKQSQQIPELTEKCVLESEPSTMPRNSETDANVTLRERAGPTF